MKKRLLYLLFFPLDIALSIFILLYTFTVRVMFLIFGKRAGSSGRTILYLSSGSNVKATLRKFGSLDPLVNYDGPAVNDFFRKQVLFWFPAPVNAYNKPCEFYEIYESKLPAGILYLTGTAVFFLKLCVLAKKERFSVIRAWDPYLCALAGWALARISGVPFCVSVHADHDKRYELDGLKGGQGYFGSRRIAKAMERFVLRRADIVMPIRESLGEYSIRNGARRETVRIIPHGIDLSPFRKEIDQNFRKDIGAGEKKLVTFAGRISRENYIYDVLEIAKELKKERSDLLFLVIGGGSEEEDVKKRIKSDNTDDIIKLLGFQPKEKVIVCRMNSCVNLCLMGGFSLIEAAASGRPVIAYDVEWHYELVKDGETGFLIKEGDTAAAAQKIGYLLDHPEIAAKMGENAKRLAFERHSLEETSKIKVKHYRELIEKHAKN